MQEVAGDLYAQPEGQEQGAEAPADEPQGGAGESEPPKKDEDDVVDADFEMVDDDKK
jgi:hypothetical protein